MQPKAQFVANEEIDFALHVSRVGKCGEFKTCSNVGDVAEDIVEGEEISNWAEAGEVVVARVLINIWMKEMTMVVGQW